MKNVAISSNNEKKTKQFLWHFSVGKNQATQTQTSTERSHSWDIEEVSENYEFYNFICSHSCCMKN